MYEKQLKNIAGDYKLMEYTETFNTVKIEIETSSLTDPCTEDIESIINSVASRDRIRFKVFEGEYAVAEYSTDGCIEDFINNIKNGIDNHDDESYKISIEIVKVFMHNELSVYDLKLFADNLKDVSFKGILNEFNKVLKDGYAIFRLQNDNCKFFSNSILFIPEVEVIDFNGTECQAKIKTVKEERELQIKKRDGICHFLNSSQYLLVPSDFDFSDVRYSLLKDIMDKLKSVLSVINICDISDIKNENEVHIILNGYKRIDSLIDYKDTFNGKITEYYEIQKWIYDGGDLSDKAGIARNVISIAVKENKLINIDNSVLPSIKSAHEIYLREHVREYIEIRNKLTQEICEMSRNTDNIVEKFIMTFKNNFIATITFFVSVVVMNCITSGHISNIFTGDIIKISLGIVAISLGFFIASIISTERNIRRFNEHYNRLKDSYDNFLNKTDIDEIFHKDEYYKKDIKYIKNEILAYKILWGVALFILLLVVIG